jgi:hypothetical protein
MVHGSGTISGMIVIIIIICIMNHHCIAAMTAVITAMVIIIIMMVDPYSHNSKSCKVRRIICVMIWGIIGHIDR